MANNIKGITIEIGGETTELDRALKSTEKKTQSLNKELRQINNQLKFDPHNAVLLQQKFDVLSEKVQQTRTKLQALKDAQSQVEDQFRRGDIGAEEYRAFQREVAAAESTLARLENQAESAKKDMDKLGKETDQTGDEFTQMGNKADSASRKVNTGLNTTSINMSSMMNIVNNIGTMISSAIQGAINLGKKIGGIVEDYLQTADDIATNSKKYGIDTNTLQGIMYASEQVDVSTETIGSSMAKITRSLKQYKKGNEDTVSGYEDLGVAITDTNGNLRSQEDIFYDVIDALGKMDDEVQADIISSQIFGRSFQELEPLVYAGSDALKDYIKEAEELGVIWSPEEIQAMNDAKDALDKLQYQLGTILAPIMEALSPHLESFANWISEKLADPAVQETLQKVAEAIGKMAEAITQQLIDFIESGQLEELLSAIIDALPAITDFIINSLPVLLNALTQITGFFAGIAQPMEDYDKKLENLSEGQDTFGSKGEIAGGLIKKAFTGGFDEIGKTIDKTMQEAGFDVEGFKTELDKQVPGMGTIFGNMMNGLTTDWGETISGMGTAISGWFDDVKTWFTNLPGQIHGFIMAIPDKIKSVFDSAKTKIEEWFTSIGNWFKELPNKIWNWIKSIPEKIAKAFSGQATVSASGKIGYRGGYAEGGIFKKSSFVNIGEAGPEVVLPLDKLGQVLTAAGYSGGGTITVNAPVQVVKELNDAELSRVGGRITDIVGRQFAKKTGGVL